LVEAVERARHREVAISGARRARPIVAVEYMRGRIANLRADADELLASIGEHRRGTVP
jgi:hypothetical protein